MTTAISDVNQAIERASIACGPHARFSVNQHQEGGGGLYNYVARPELDIELPAGYDAKRDDDIVREFQEKIARAVNNVAYSALDYTGKYPPLKYETTMDSRHWANQKLVLSGDHTEAFDNSQNQINYFNKAAKAGPAVAAEIEKMRAAIERNIAARSTQSPADETHSDGKAGAVSRATPATATVIQR